jgi:hypothetical protein
MNLNKQEREYKIALSLLREKNELYNKLYKIKPIKLDVPIFHGYYRTLVLENETKLRGDYIPIKKAFELFHIKKTYSKTKSFIKETRNGFHEAHAYLITLKDPRFAFYWKESSREEDAKRIEESKKYLRLCHDRIMCQCQDHSIDKTEKHFKCHYTFKFPWMYKEITKPHYLTHYTPVDGDIETRIKEIDRQLNNHQYYNILYERCYDSAYFRKEWVDKKSEMNRILHSIQDDDI